jgi:hypothetical protein
MSVFRDREAERCLTTQWPPGRERAHAARGMSATHVTSRFQIAVIAVVSGFLFQGDDKHLSEVSAFDDSVFHD